MISRFRKWYLAAFVLFVPLLAYAAAAAYVRSADAAARVSAIATRAAGRDVRVERMELRGLGIALFNTRVAGNPGDPPLLSAGRVDVVPGLGILRGKTALRRLSLIDISADLRKEKGIWNFQPIADHLSRRKKPEGTSGETSLGLLELRNGTLRVNGQSFEKITFTARNIAAASAGTSFSLAFADSRGNGARLQGTRDAQGAVNAALDAPRFLLSDLAPLFPPSLDVSKGIASTDIKARIAAGNITVSGKVAVAGVQGTTPKGPVPVSARAAFEAGYDTARREGKIDRLDVGLWDGDLRGNVRGTFRTGEEFDIRGDADMAVPGVSTRLAAFLPKGIRIADGAVSLKDFRLRKTGGKISEAEGAARLTRLHLMKDGTTLLRNGEARLALLRAGEGWKAAGEISADDPAAQVSFGRAPVEFALTPLLRLSEAHADSVPVRVAGVSFTGSIRHTAGKETAAEVHAERVDLALINRFLAGKKVELQGSGNIHGACRITPERRIDGSFSVSVADAAATASEKRFTVEEASVSGKVQGGADSIAASGTMQWRGSGNGHRFDIATPWHANRSTLLLSSGRAVVDDVTAAFQSVHIDLPKAQGEFAASVKGGSFRRGDMAGEGIDADFRGMKRSGGIAGTGSFSAPVLSLRGRRLGAVTGTVSTGTDGTALKADALLLGGKLVGAATLPSRGKASFFLNGSGMSAQEAEAVAGPGQRLRGGTFGLDLHGTAAGDDLDVSGKLYASDLVVGAGEKLFPQLGVRAAVRLDRRRLLVEQGTFSAGDGMGGTFSADVADPLRPSRSGRLSLDLQEKQLAALVSSAPGFLPSGWEGSGTYAGKLRVNFTEKERTASGFILLQGVSLENRSQHMAISGITGRIPLSADLLQAAQRPHKDASYSRENFAQLIQAAAAAPSAPGGEVVTIDRISVGAVETTGARMLFRGEGGITELQRLEIPLFGGTITGKAFLRPGRGMMYGGDLLIHDLSLLKLCDAVPGVKGYLSGRVNGVLSIQGDGSGMAGTNGFLDIWTRDSRREKRLVSRHFLQKLAGKQLKGIFFRDDRRYDRGEITATLEAGYVTFRRLQMEHTNLLGVKDLNVNVAPEQNRIALDHLLKSIREATLRGKRGGQAAEPQKPLPVETEFNWLDEK